MCRAHRTNLSLPLRIPVLWIALLLPLLGCAGDPNQVPVPTTTGEAASDAPAIERRATKTRATVRAERRAYDGAPPVIPHENLGIQCTACHNREGMAVTDLGFAPPSPHEETGGLSALSRCQQCHVFSRTEDVWMENEFTGLPQNLRSGGRLHPLAAPTIPHRVFMRENCQACHTGPAAREEVRTTHPERPHCRQCHVPVTEPGTFEPTTTVGPG